MTVHLECGRKYTWGHGTHVYEKVKGKGVYCHTVHVWLRSEHAKDHESVVNYPDFRYIDTEISSSDDVRKPSHYQVFPDVESIEIIARSMTQAEFKGFCMGNVLKYRLRAGKKSELATMEKDLKKADFYKELFEQHKDKCYE